MKVCCSSRFSHFLYVFEEFADQILTFILFSAIVINNFLKVAAFVWTCAALRRIEDGNDLSASNSTSVWRTNEQTISVSVHRPSNARTSVRLAMEWKVSSFSTCIDVVSSAVFWSAIEKYSKRCGPWTMDRSLGKPESSQLANAVLNPCLTILFRWLERLSVVVVLGRKFNSLTSAPSVCYEVFDVVTKSRIWPRCSELLSSPRHPAFQFDLTSPIVFYFWAE